MKKLISVWLTACLTAVVFAGGTLAESAMIAPGDNLVVEGIPSIPATLADEVGRYTEFRSAGISSWHPSRREMLISTRFGETNQVHLLKNAWWSTHSTHFFTGAVGRSIVPPQNRRLFCLQQRHRRQ